MNGSESNESILQALKTDGAVILDSLLPKSTTSKIASELKPYLDACPQGVSDFAGTSTKRIGALMARSGTCRDLALHPLINDLCAEYLKWGFENSFTTFRLNDEEIYEKCKSSPSYSMLQSAGLEHDFDLFDTQILVLV